ncbi:hypothetical protein K432DRAFT_220984 [Lepidopterella palustris CBS 459.81]|uniref:Uncharacterized protein n=1 Tax=Lepidopterella palustris CBS 459.81 TaxID=1314670 RepID=A0A8E2J9M0_9PEZI|nr:hypothetical protein K432DRAFT_220984 [Lepidopterella palustris CBS 459.81]
MLTKTRQATATGGMPAMSGHGHSRRDGSRFAYTRKEKRQFAELLLNRLPSTLVTKGQENKASFYAPVKSTFKSGFWLGKDDTISTNIEAVNYRNESREIYFAIDYEYLPFPESKLKDYFDVGMGMMSSSGCGGLIFHPPKDKAITYKLDIWEVSENGYILNIHPHL